MPSPSKVKTVLALAVTLLTGLCGQAYGGDILIDSGKDRDTLMLAAPGATDRQTPRLRMESSPENGTFMGIEPAVRHAPSPEAFPLIIRPEIRVRGK